MRWPCNMRFPETRYMMCCCYNEETHDGVTRLGGLATAFRPNRICTMTEEPRFGHVASRLN